MAQDISELIKKMNPVVVEAARAKAEHDILKMRSAQLRQVKVKIASLRNYVQALDGKLTLDVELADGRHIGI